MSELQHEESNRKYSRRMWMFCIDLINQLYEISIKPKKSCYCQQDRNKTITKATETVRKNKKLHKKYIHCLTMKQ